MLEYMQERILQSAQYILLTEATVRQCATKFGISKSTVHKDMTERLQNIDYSLYEKVRKILNKNLHERHIRGGNATKKRYKEKSLQKDGL